LEGLELNEMLLSEVVDASISFRCESEFFKKKIMLAKALIEDCPIVSLLTEVAPDIQHPVEITRAYAESGYRMLLAQEVRCNQIVLGEGSYLDNPNAQFVKRNKLELGDVVLTRTGANFGQCAPVLFDDELFACADLLIIRKGAIPAGYLSTFLNTWQGRLLLDRGAYGAAQPHIAPTYLKNLPIPIFSNLIEPISKLVEKSAATRKKGVELLNDAEKYLLSALSLDSWTPPAPLSYVRSSSDAFSSGRLDSQYFAPRVRELMKRLGQNGLCIRDVAPARQERFKPSDSGMFDYIEIGGLGSDGTATAEALEQKEAPSRATQFVRTGDVITSTVRPIRRLSALVAEEQDGNVCSSGFVVLNPQKISSEVLLTYLRLPLFCELMDLHTSATMYPAISETDLLSLPIPAIDAKTQLAIQQAVREAAASRQRANNLLDAAKRAVEIAIEDSEAAALAFIKEVI
jgi:type I restriction enzyme, S subunit